MKSIILSNGIKLIYSNCDGGLTSFCIGFDAGADREDIDEIGVAHAVEHMVFKGTKNLTEEEINNKCDELFAFNNAMTNFPYSIYYGVSTNEDFEESFELYSDILVNADLTYGFEEEMGAIKAEYREWKDDMVQYCEDELYKNTFNTRRMKNLIIGSIDDIDNIRLEKLKNFYEKYYVSNNCVVSVVSSLPLEEIKEMVEKKLGGMKKGSIIEKSDNYEFSNYGTYTKSVQGLEGAKIQYCFDISCFDEDEIEMLNIFNVYLGEGVSSYLYDSLRTKKGLVYDVSSKVHNERGIKMLTINASSSKEDIDEVKNIIDNIINNISLRKIVFSDEQISRLRKIKNRKWYIDIERKIVLAVRLATYSIMYGDENELIDRLENNKNISSYEISKVASKAMERYSVQIIR